MRQSRNSWEKNGTKKLTHGGANSLLLGPITGVLMFFYEYYVEDMKLDNWQLSIKGCQLLYKLKSLTVKNKVMAILCWLKWYFFPIN